jgi:hypothetical protein
MMNICKYVNNLWYEYSLRKLAKKHLKITGIERKNELTKLKLVTTCVVVFLTYLTLLVSCDINLRNGFIEKLPTNLK